MPDGPVPTSVSDRDETPSERADRNFGELVQELRVAQTGVQILFAFLLTLAFYASFPKDDPGFAYPLAGALLAVGDAGAVGVVVEAELHPCRRPALRPSSKAARACGPAASIRRAELSRR